ncbi:MAG: hypothetical protein E7342_03765 [Clostridiales bacterium]|nr:hypothetical protein [Clostridiales bacterium]
MLSKNQIAEIQRKPSSELSFAESFIYNTLEDIQVIKKNFVRVGYRLLEAVQLHYVEELGYNNIYELAEDVFCIKKSMCYDLINIATYYCNGMQLKERYKNFSQSQLIELCHVPSHLQEYITSDMTVLDIRDYKNCFKYSGVYNGIPVNEPYKAIELYREKKTNNSGRPENNQTQSIRTSANNKNVCTYTNFALLLSLDRDFNYYMSSKNYNNMIERIFEILKENNLSLFADFLEPSFDSFLYEFYSTTDEGLTGVYRCVTFEDKEKAIELHKKKKRPFLIKIFKQIKEQVFNEEKNT